MIAYIYMRRVDLVEGRPEWPPEVEEDGIIDAVDTRSADDVLAHEALLGVTPALVEKAAWGNGGSLHERDAQEGKTLDPASPGSSDARCSIASAFSRYLARRRSLGHGQSGG